MAEKINYIEEIDNSLERISRTLNDSSEKVWHFRRSTDKKFLVIIGLVFALMVVNVICTVINMNSLKHINLQLDNMSVQTK